MSEIRPFALVHTAAQWRDCEYDDTRLDPATVTVQLLGVSEPDPPKPGCASEPAGLAFDAHCRLYHALPEAGQVERLLWGHGSARDPQARDTVPVFEHGSAEGPDAQRGEFTPAPARDKGPLCRPVGLAADDGDHLFVSEAGSGLIWIYDLWERRLLRKVSAGATGAIDLVCDGRKVYGAGPELGGLLMLDARTGPRLQPWPAQFEGTPLRLALSPRGELYVLVNAGKPGAPRTRVVRASRPDQGFDVPDATGLAVAGRAYEREAGGRDVLVVARAPGHHLRRYVLGDEPMELPPLAARGYDGRGIVRTPDGRIGFWTMHGFRQAVVARMRYRQRGHVTTFCLDAGVFQARWGRVFVDACIPRGADVRVHTRVTDDLSDAATLPRVTVDEITGRLHLRDNAPGAWAPTSDGFATYEAPVTGGTGRYLWLSLALSGDTRVTPRVRSARVERLGHALLRLLPKVFSRTPESADFLHRYLGIADSVLADVGARATTRHALLDPRSAPAEMLPWLAELLGLVLDARWPEPARRAVIQEAMWLFRFRGTVPGLRRLLEIFLGRPPVLFEHFRLPLLGGTHAHRFTVVLPAILDPEQHDVIEKIIALHSPAHAEYDLCTLDRGMRVGMRLYAGMTSMIGPGSELRPARLGSMALGRDGVLGRPRAGARVEEIRVGKESWIR